MSAPATTAQMTELAVSPPESRAATLDAIRRAPWRWVAYNIIAWTAIGTLFTLQTALHAPTSFARHWFASVIGFLPCALFTPIIAAVALRYRMSDGVRRALAAHVVTYIVFQVIGGAMMGALEWILPWEPTGEGLVAAMTSAIGRYVAIDSLLYVMVAMGATALAYGRESRERAVRAARLQAQLAEAQLHALSAQLHPHFLFNTLHAISALIRPDPKRAEQLIARLSELLRQMLDTSSRLEVTLEEELAFLEKYVDIQEARFGPRLSVSFEVAPAVLGALVPPLVLQPLVENAIRHGVARRTSPGRVEVRASCERGTLTLVVSDDGVGLPAGAMRDGVGLGSTRARLAQLYGERASLRIAPRAGGGTVCTVIMPCRQERESA